MATSSKGMVLKTFSYLKEFFVKEIIILVLVLLRNAGALSFPYFLKVIIDDVYPASDFNLLLKILGIIVGIQFLSALAGILSAYLLQQVSNGIMENLRSDLFEHVIHLPIDFYNKNDLGEVVHSLSNEVKIIQGFLTTSLIELVNSIVLITSISFILYFLNPRLFLICISLIPILLVTISFFHSRMRKYITLDRKADASVLSFMIEKLDNALLIKLFNQYKFEVGRLRSRIKDYVRVNLKATFISAQGSQLSIFIIAMAPVLVIGFGSKGVFEGILTLGTLIAFIEYFNLLVPPSRAVVGLYYNALRALESMNRVMSFFDIPIPDKAQINETAPETIESISCQQVHLTLGESEILKYIDFEFRKGKSYGFVGGSGSGKSSLMFLLCGLYKPTSGGVFINEINAQDIGVYGINEKVGLVRSTTKLQKGTIRENLLYGLTDSKDEALFSMLKVVGLYEYVSDLPGKLDTDISDLGTKLSDGQRQRLSIARALLKDTQVLILDEATSAMDSITETNVINNILEIYRDRILIVISHRLSSIQNLDEIICLKDGLIVEQNSHAELLESKGEYWELFKEQLIYE